MIETKTLFGIHQPVHPQAFVVDRTNLFNGRVELHVYEDARNPNPSYMTLNAGAAVASAAGITSLASGGFTGPTCIGVERRYDEENSMAIYSYTFEGIATDHSKKFIEFELEFTMTQEPIETHPNFAALNDKFGPYDALNRLWPQYITEETTGGLTGTTQGNAVLNPMFGVSSYFNPGVMYRRSYTSPDVDSKALSGIGTIVIPPTSEGSSVLFSAILSWVLSPGQNRNWLKMAPKVRQHGSCVAIIEEYMLSGFRGWNPNVYQASGGSGSGLGGGQGSPGGL